jgi:uncharacterized damage-inducible protein DinB
MNTASLLTTQYGILQRQFTGTLKDLTLEQLQWQPVPEANSIGFLLWHILRTWDSYASLINNQDELYESDGWRERFGLDTRGRGVEGSDTGTEFAPEDVRIVKPQPETLLDYLRALSEQAERSLADANDENLSQEMIVPWWPEPPTIARVHTHILAHSYIHLGEAQYLRGLIPE